jgi:hypothetical protein
MVHGMLPLPDVRAAAASFTGTTVLVTRERERLRKLAGFPLLRGFERLDRTRLVEMEYGVELFDQSRPE